jgi:hypothetical protein
MPALQGAVLAAPVDVWAEPHRVGDALLVVPSNQPDRVWLVSRAERSAPTVEERDVSGRLTSGPATLPVDRVPRAAMAEGLVVTSGDGFEVWDPSSKAVIFRSPSRAVFAAASGHTLAWSAGCDTRLCPLHLTTLPSGNDRTVYLPGDSVGLPVFSADGKWLAVERRSLATAATAPNSSQIVVIDVAAGTADSARLPGSSRGVLSWNSAGTWVFSLGVEGGSGGQIYAYKRGATAATSVRMLWHGPMEAIVAS